ncbi:MAG: SelB C-terminal domain-containing protein, partial [Thermodesulfovibrionales bacterium]|nr:SelB C-terminal domain-containing protein [Thermodesulfovibrionales bacterium]
VYKRQIGGGTVLDPIPNKRKKKEGIDDLLVYDKGSLLDKILMKIKKSGMKGLTANFIEGWMYGDLTEIRNALKRLLDDNKLVFTDDLYLSAELVFPIRQRVLEILKVFHTENPLKQGLQKEELRARLSKELKTILNDTVFDFIIKTSEIQIEKDFVRLSDFKAELSSVDSTIKNKILNALEKNRFQPPTKSELLEILKISEKEINDLLKLMTKEGLLVRINEGIYITQNTYDELIKILKSHFQRKQQITLSEFRDLLNTSRKYALPFMEYLDSKKVTLRIGDIRKLMIK